MSSRRDFLKAVAGAPLMGTLRLAHFVPIPLDDPATFRLIGEGDTEGLGTPRKTDLLIRMKPRNFDELIAVVAIDLFPESLKKGTVEAYINRRSGREKVVYLHSVSQQVLGQTHGIILYQEQVGQLLHRLGGIAEIEGPKLLTAITEKNDQAVEDHRVQFVKGARLGGVEVEVADQAFACIVLWGRSSCSKTLAAALAFALYRAAYRKVHST